MADILIADIQKYIADFDIQFGSIFFNDTEVKIQNGAPTLVLERIQIEEDPAVYAIKSTKIPVFSRPNQAKFKS